MDPLSKSRHPVMLPLQIILVFLCQSPIIRLCCHCESRVGVQYFVKVPIIIGLCCCTANHVWIQYFVKVPSSGYVVALQTMCGFNILSKSHHPVMLLHCKPCVDSIFCQSPIIRLCCCTANHVWIQYFVKVPSSGYVVALQTMCGFNILSKSHHPVMLLHCKPCVDSIFCQSPIIRLCCCTANHVWIQYFVKVPSSGYVVALQTMCGFNVCQSPFIRLCSTTIGRDGVRLCIFVPTSRHPVNVPSEGRSCCVMCNQFPFPCIISVIYLYSSKYHHPVALQ